MTLRLPRGTLTAVVYLTAAEPAALAGFLGWQMRVSLVRRLAGRPLPLFETSCIQLELLRKNKTSPLALYCRSCLRGVLVDASLKTCFGHGEVRAPTQLVREM